MARASGTTQSIQAHVLNAAFNVIAVVALLLVVTVVLLIQFHHRDELTRDAGLHAATLAEAVAAPLANRDTTSLQTALGWWHTDSAIDSLAIFNAAGERLAGLGVNTMTAPGDGTDNVDITLDAVTVRRPVIFENKQIGVVVLRQRFDDVTQRTLVVTGGLLLATLLMLSVARLVLRQLAARIVQPLNNLGEVAGAIARSPDRWSRASEAGPGEVADLARTFNSMVDTLQLKAQTLDLQLKEQARTEARLDFLAHYDQITGLANRVQFHKELPRAAERARRAGNNLAVVFLDLDDFKLVNDTLGHDIGDRLLRAAAERLTQSLRKGDFVCRLGGDEFTLILEGITSLRTAVQVVSKLIETLAEAYDIDDNSLHVGVSAGIALYPVQTDDLSDLLRFADIAMYQAKNSGKNDYCVFTSELVSRTGDRLSIESDLRRGLENGEFFLDYQPQIDMHSGRFVGMEALLRWNHPHRGLLAPDYFIEVAEKSGLIVPIGRQVINMACHQWQAWRELGLEPPRLAVNVSGRQLHEENFADELIAAISVSGRPMPLLELEITESLLLADTQVSKAMFHQLAAMGIEWSLDDFGTGYSSLTYLAKFPIRNIKIDRSFIARVPGNENSEAIVKAIIAMARGLGMRVITEGVETQEQVDYLLELGQLIGQGYYYSKPVSPDEITRLLRRQAAGETFENGEPDA